MIHSQAYPLASHRDWGLRIPELGRYDLIQIPLYHRLLEGGIYGDLDAQGP